MNFTDVDRVDVVDFNRILSERDGGNLIPPR
jgi:hypothetical protein